MAITYTVPTDYGTATRKSSMHTMAGKRYRFVAAHIWRWNGQIRFYTWHSRRDLAQRECSGHHLSKLGQVVEITDAMCREHANRKEA